MKIIRALIPLAIAALGASQEANAITGGVAVSRLDPISRSVVLIKIETQDREAACTGFVWSADLIVTAAHCLTGRPTALDGLDAPSRKAALLQAPALPLDAVKIYYRHAGRWARPRRLAFDRAGDRGLVFMSREHPKGYVVPLIDTRSAATLVEDGQDETFISVGHTGLETGGIGTLQSLKTKARTLLLQASTGNIMLERIGEVGTCHGDSGAPVYIERPGGILLLVGMHQGGPTANAAFVVPGTEGRCSRVSVIVGMDRLKPWIVEMRSKTAHGGNGTGSAQ
jgi:hypothetical protein